jgi:proline dehydrogenase
VSIASRDETAIRDAAARIERETGSAVLATALDVRSAEGIDAWIKASADRFGGVDALMTNSGGPPAGAAISFDDRAWQDAADLLLFSTLRMVRGVVPLMQQRGGGAILVSTSSSVKGHQSRPSTVLRASVSALAKTLALELAPMKSVSQIIPDASTPTASVSSTRSTRRSRVCRPTRQSEGAGRIPMGRAASPASSAASARFCSRWPHMTGATVQVDGGLIRSVLWRFMALMRKALLAASTNAWLRNRATKRVRPSVGLRFMPGERVGDALRAAKELTPQGITTILTRLGENLTKVEEAEDVTQHYLDVLDKIAESGLDSQISVKPTQLGLDLDRELCYRNLERLLDRAAQRGNSIIWIDMEGSPYVDPTLDLVRRARKKTSRIGVALQAYLYRTAKDVEDLIPLGIAVRVVKGAYLEPPDIAFPKKSDTDENYYKLCTRLLADDAQKAGVLLHIGTHDGALVDRLLVFIARNNIPRSAYEFAMLYGIQRGEQLKLAAGQRLRVLISYGEYWFPWYMRRLAERPANVWFVVRTMFG